MSIDRLRWWLVIVLTKLFGRNVKIEDSGGRTLRLLPIVWGQKLYLLGSERENLQIDYTSPYTLRLRRAPVVSLSPGETIREGQRPFKMASVHAVLSHLPPEKTDLVLDYLQQLQGSSELVLAYGGSAQNFDKIRFQKKVFIADDKLRGVGYRQSYFAMMKEIRDYCLKNEMDAEWILLSDYDLIPLNGEYLNELIALMKRHGAGFGGKVVRDISLSNSFFLTNAIKDGILDGKPLLSRLERKPIYHCLGAFLLFHRNCFEAVLELADDLNEMYFELAIPTAASLKGFRLISFDEHCDLLKQVRYRPTYAVGEAVELAAHGAAVLHPIKDLAAFLAQRSSPVRPLGVVKNQ